MMVDYYRRLATNSEIDVLFGLHRDAFRNHVEQLWGQWDENWQRDNFRRECAESSCEAVVSGETLLGYVQHAAEPGRLRIWNIALWPQFRGQTIGTRIILEFQVLAQSRDVELALRVFPTNQAALRFYLKLGFRESARTATGVELLWCPA